MVTVENGIFGALTDSQAVLDGLSLLPEKAPLSISESGNV
jgi:hypothetical protein